MVHMTTVIGAARARQAASYSPLSSRRAALGDTYQGSQMHTPWGVPKYGTPDFQLDNLVVMTRISRTLADYKGIISQCVSSGHFYFLLISLDTFGATVLCFKPQQSACEPLVAGGKTKYIIGREFQPRRRAIAYALQPSDDAGRDTSIPCE